MSEVRRLIYGTGNPAKLEDMRKRLGTFELEIIGLKDLDRSLVIPEIAESGRTPLENAEQKALGYYRAFHMPVFSCDSGLYIDGLPEELQPGVHVRNVRGKHLSDGEMQEYYSSLAQRYGEERKVPLPDGREEKVKALKARYRNAICLVMDEEHIYKAMKESMASESFLIVSKSHPVRQRGFPLDGLSVDIRTGRYYYDLKEERLEQVAVADGFLEFFREIFGQSDKKPTEICRVDIIEAEELSALATAILREHYDPIVGTVQNDYMLEMFQSTEAIRSQIEHGYQYYWVRCQGENAGFMAFFPRDGKMYLSKLYVEKTFRGRHLAKQMLDFVAEKSVRDGYRQIFLNVNKYNKETIDIYYHLGFVKVRDEKNDIGGGFYMDDYVLEYTIPENIN